MNRPDKAGEPSMEEILASIRQTIAAEQEGKSAPADRPVPGHFSRTNGVPRPGTSPSERAQPSLGRLTDALKQHAPAPSNGLGSKRPASFDDDLADILDEPTGANGAKVTAPKPSISIAPDVPGFLVPRTSEAKAASAPQPQTLPAPSPAPAPPVEAQPASAPAPQPNTTSYTIPMRRGGFYPPAGYTPTLPSLPPLPEPPPSVEPARNEAAASPTQHPDGVLKRLADLDAGAPASPLVAPAPAAAAEKPAVATEPAASAPFTAESTSVSVSEPTPQLGPAPFAVSAGSQPAPEPEPKLAPVSEGPRPVALVRGLADSLAATAEPETSSFQVAEVPIEAPAPEPELVIETVIAELLTEPEPIEVFEPVEVVEPIVEPLSRAPDVETVAPEPVPVERPVSASGYAPQSYNGANYTNGHTNGAHYNGTAPAAPTAPEPPVRAAKLALDALAQGLAAAASHPMPQQPVSAPAPRRADPYTSPPTTTLVPVAEPDLRQYSGAPHAPAVSHYDPQLPVRTLEDTVADMLKPLLQQWLADNMPRIIEKALRVEAASAVKKGHKPPGS